MIKRKSQIVVVLVQKSLPYIRLTLHKKDISTRLQVNQ